MPINIYNASPEDTLSLSEMQLYQLIMSYRIANGLSIIPLSNALTITAARHALDTVENIGTYTSGEPGENRAHSWSDAPYDGRNPGTYANMWTAPARLNTGYSAYGFEISIGYEGSNVVSGNMTPFTALAGWQGSPGHNAVILSQSPWDRADLQWQAIGISIYHGVADVWFGASRDAIGPTIVGTSASETIVGGPEADTLIGGGGNDLFVGTLAEMAGDVITDFSAGDRLSITGLAAAGLSYEFAKGVISIGGKTITLAGYSGSVSVRASADGQAIFAAPTATHIDFSGDGRSDLLFRNVNGSVSTWNVSGDGRAVQQSAFNASVDTSWKIAETLDRNGDGRSDMLFRNDNGAVAIWDSTGAGFNQASYYHASVSTAWRIAATGDLDGDGRDDILWQNSNGAISAWTSTGSGFVEGSYNHNSPGAGWLVEGLGDFNGDGKADILWRNSDGGVAVWTNNGSGTSFSEGAFFQKGVPTSWHIDGIGDVNGDGRDDLIWRNDNGAVTVWRSNSAGGFDQSVFNASVATSWHIAQVGDLNGDGRADIFWHNDDGAVSTWQSNGAGFDQAVYNSSAPTSWDIAGHDFVL